MKCCATKEPIKYVSKSRKKPNERMYVYRTGMCYSFFLRDKKNLQIEWNHINFTFFSVIVFIILMSTVWIIGCLISMLFDTQLIKRSFSFFSAEMGFWNGIYEWNVTSFKFRNRRFTQKKISPLKECHYSHSSMIF